MSAKSRHDKIRSVLLASLQQAGSALKETLLQRKVVAEKEELSLVTETDRRAEELIVKNILNAFPDHAIMTEESPPRGSSPCRWIIDPLDGTTNFAHTYPVACTSIAFEENGKIRVSGIFDPFRKELFYAERGKGASLNGKRIRVSPNRSLGQCLLGTGFPYDRRHHADEYLTVFKAFMLRVQGIRRTGAAAIDLAYVACGRFDGFWELKLNIWDMAAAWLIIEEAGGKLSEFDGGPLQIPKSGHLMPQVVASNSLIHQEMVEVLSPFAQMGK